MLEIRVTKKKNGQVVPWFRDVMGRRVRTSESVLTGGMNWATRDQMVDIGLYGLQLILDRTEKAIGSDDAPMPPLKISRKKRFSKSRQSLVEYGKLGGYAEFKHRVGLKPIRDLRGIGGRVVSYTGLEGKHYLRSGTAQSRAFSGGHGHMLDDIRINYVDDKKVQFGITNTASRQKAAANEARASWWGWSPQDISKLSAYCARVFDMNIESRMLTLGFAGRSRMSISTQWARASASIARRGA